MKLWGDSELDDRVAAYTVGNDHVLDRKLVRYDCIASKAHARMLAAVGLLAEDEAAVLVEGLEAIEELSAAGKFVIRPEQEDCHTAIEQFLVERVGEAGKKIHTGRSRNDQVLTALRLFYRDELERCRASIVALVDVLRRFIRRFGKVQTPGWTHTRKAMPSSVGMWAGALVDSMIDNRKAVAQVAKLMDQSPLGSGAGYGLPLPLDRKMTARELGFSRVQRNPIYVQNSRGKFEAAMLHVLGQVLLDLNRVSADLIWFSMPEFGFFVLPERFTTGSSIMPQKRNPDVLELVRANYHVIVGLETQLKSQLANQIHGYHRDLQLTKEPALRGLQTTQDALEIMTLVFSGLEVDRGACARAMTPELFATRRAYELARTEGLPFRDAYLRVKKEMGYSVTPQIDL